MTSAARKVAIAIIVILILAIGWFLYGDYKPRTSGGDANTAGETSSVPGRNGSSANPYSYNQDYIKQLVAEKFSNQESLKVLDPATYQGIYKTANLLISSDSSSAAVKKYGLQMIQALKPLAVDRKNEVELTIKALNDRDEAAVQTLVAAKNNDNRMIQDLLLIRVPKTAAAVHLAVINALYSDSVLLNNMSGVMDDPYFALTSTSAYLAVHAQLFKILGNLNSYFLNNGVKFSEQENMKIYVNL